MTRRTFLAGICITALLICTPNAYADDAADVRALSDKYVELMNDGDGVALAGLFHPKENSFGGLADLLGEGIHTEATMKAMFAGGFKTVLAWRHQDVNVVGSTAVVTGYWIGTAVLPDGRAFNNPWRVSMVWAKGGDGWKVLHVHLSRLE